MNERRFVRLVKYDPGRLGRITAERSDWRGPLYTVRLDEVGWPGGSDAVERSECRMVDLRSHEFYEISPTEHRRLTQASARAAPLTNAEKQRRAYARRRIGGGLPRP